MVVWAPSLTQTPGSKTLRLKTGKDHHEAMELSQGHLPACKVCRLSEWVATRNFKKHDSQHDPYSPLPTMGYEFGTLYAMLEKAKTAAFEAAVQKAGGPWHKSRPSLRVTFWSHAWLRGLVVAKGPLRRRWSFAHASVANLDCLDMDSPGMGNPPSPLRERPVFYRSGGLTLADQHRKQELGRH